MQKPEGITQEQFDELMAHFNENPPPKIVEHGKFETNNLFSKEELEARRRNRRR